MLPKCFNGTFKPAGRSLSLGYPKILVELSAESRKRTAGSGWLNPEQLAWDDGNAGALESEPGDADASSGALPGARPSREAMKLIGCMAQVQVNELLRGLEARRGGGSEDWRLRGIEAQRTGGSGWAFQTS